MEKGFSIIVCCYNSAPRIEATLRHLFNLTIPDGLNCEVLVVDNNSSDKTGEIADQAEKSFNRQRLEFKIITERKTGLSYARKAGVSASRFDIIIFCDDDNQLNQNYLIAANDIFQPNPEIGIIGGNAEPGFSSSGREWIKDFYASMAIGPQAAEEGYVNWVYGAGMVLRKEVFNKLDERKIQPLLSDRAGKVLTSGGDSELCGLALFVGFKIYYSSSLKLTHAVPEHRLRRKHYLKASIRTIFPSIHLFILDEVLHNSNGEPGDFYRKKLRESGTSLFYFLPRIFLGSHQFFSFFMFYRTSQMVLWLLFNKKAFMKMHESILLNLSLPSV